MMITMCIGNVTRDKCERSRYKSAHSSGDSRNDQLWCGRKNQGDAAGGDEAKQDLVPSTASANMMAATRFATMR